MTKPIDKSEWSIERKLVVDRIKDIVTFFREMDAVEVSIGPVSVKFRETTPAEIMEAHTEEKLQQAQMQWTELPEEEKMRIEQEQRESLFYHSS